MKIKYLIMAATVLLSACTQLDELINVGSNATPKEKFRACALSEARTKLRNGTLFTQSLETAKNDIVNTCLKKMALEAAGIDSEAQNIASNIINALKS